MQNDKDFLGTEPVGKLLMKLAVPTVTAQIINMLYNICLLYTSRQRHRGKGISGCF